MKVTSKSFEQPKTGYVKAKCLSAIDGRYNYVVYNGIGKWVKKLFLIFEIDQKITIGDKKYIGKNMIVVKEFTASASPDSIFRRMLENWRKERFGEKLDSNGDITLMTKKLNSKTKKYEAVPFQIEYLQGLDCLLKLENVGKDKSYITVTEILQLPRNEAPIENENTIGYVPDNLARKIAARPERNPDELSEPIREYSDAYLGEDDGQVPF